MIGRGAVILALVAVATPARAAEDTIWDRVIADAEVEAAKDTYQRQLQAGDEDVQLAGAEGNWRDKKRLITGAITAYRAAIAAVPDEPEAHWRLAATLFAYYLTCDANQTPLCDPHRPDPVVMRDVVDHWDRFTELSPLDPRGTSILFSRAILHTKLATKADFLAAIADYETTIKRAEDGDSDPATALANLAETYMMVGRLEDAITAYERAASEGGATSTVYGLAVALDRDGQRTRARQLIERLRMSAFEQFKADILEGKTFFVPPGEVHYYLALVEEALGLPEKAIEDWDRFIASGAHPQFRPAAKRNRDALLAKHRKPTRGTR